MESLTRQQVIDVITGKSAAPRIPVALHFWSGSGAFPEDKRDFVESVRNRYPSDVDFKSFEFPTAYYGSESDPSFRWINYKEPPETDGAEVGLDSNNYIEDFEAEIDLFVNSMPKASFKELFSGSTPGDGTKYSVCHWWFCLFERHWWLRGMENALTDYYLYPEAVHKLFRGLTDLYKGVIIRAREELNVDAIFTSDDLGTQAGPFFSNEIFEKFFKPYYKEIIDTVHENGMQFWLHACGNIEPFIPHFIDVGVDVLHPIQKYALDETEIVKKYGGKICFWAGFDVQQIIPYGTADDVKKEVKHLIETYNRPDGRLILTAGNAITGDCPLDSYEALYRACYEPDLI